MKILIFFLAFSFSLYLTAQHTASDNVSTFTIEATPLNTEKKIWIYLPKNYHKTNKKFPVMYMHDAQNLFDASTSYVGEWKVDETLNKLNAEVIIVGIEHGGEKRTEELTPYPHQKYKGGKGKLYIDFMLKILKPRIDAMYRTLPDAGNTAIAGSSLGGLISFYAVMTYPETFGKAIIFSPSFWFSDNIYTLVKKRNTIPNVKLYFATGEKEGKSMVNGHKKMRTLLLEKGLASNNIKSVIVKEKEHNETFWSEEFPKAYTWLMPKTLPKN